MQRRKISGAEIKPNANSFVSGNLNAEKCIAYLRGIGVEIDDATAESWMDTQGVFRFLRSEKTSWRTGWVHRCRCGGMEGFSEQGRGSKWAREMKKRSAKRQSKPAKCDDCGEGFVFRGRLYDVLRDGSIQDWRGRCDKDNVWQPIAEYVAERSELPPDDDSPAPKGGA